MKKILLWLLVLLLGAGTAFALPPSGGVLVDDGTTSGKAINIRFPNSSITSLSGGTVTLDLTGATGAPLDAPYLTTTAVAGLSGESNLGGLTTGLVKITVSGGVATPSTASAGTDYQAASAILLDVATNMADPNANTLAGWDDTDGTWRWLTIGSGLSYDHATHTLTSTGAAPAFSEVTAGTNTAALVIGNSGSLSTTGTGTITATNMSIASEAQGDLLLRGASVWGRLAKGTENYPLVAGASAPSYAQLTAAGIANGTITTTQISDTAAITGGQLATALSRADGSLIDLSGITMSASTDEGLTLPAWANVTPSTTTKYFLAWDTSAKAVKIQDGGSWYTFGSTAAPVDSPYLLIGANDATLTGDRRLALGVGLAGTDAGANSTYTLAVDLSTLVAAQTLWDGSQASRTLTFNLSGTDPVLTFTSGVINVSTGSLQVGGVGVATLTSPTFTTSILPVSAGGATIGSTSAEWGNIYLTDSAVIYGQADQSNSLTSSATAWTASGNLVADTFVPTEAANANGEFGYASNAFSWFANSEDLTLTFGSNLATFASGTSATVAFTPAVALNGGANVTTALTPAAAGGSTLGTTALEWGNVYLTNSAVIYGQADQSNSLTSSATGWTANLNLSAAAFIPTSAANAAGEFGYASNAFSWFGGATSEDVTLTFGSNLATWASNTSATFAFTPSVALNGGATVATSLAPVSNDGAALGTSSLMFSDLFLASGAVINFNNGDVTATHSANTLALAGASSGYTFDAALLPSTAGGASIGSATAEWDNLYLHDGAVIYGQADQSATLTSSAGKWTATAFDITGNSAVGDADTDTLTIRSLIVGGNSRAVWIAGSAPTPTYATGTNDLYVGDSIEAGGTVYASAFVGGTGTDGQRRIDFTSNTSFTCSGNQLYFLNNVLYACENGTGSSVVLPADSVTWTGTTHSFAGVTNLTLPTATPDAAGEIGGWTSNAWATGRGTYKLYDGTAVTYLVGVLASDTPSNGQVLKWNTGGTITWEDDNSAGSPTLDTVGNPAADATFTFDAGEEISWQYTGSYTTGTQFLIQQQTGNPSGGVLFEVRGADSDSVLARFGDGTNYLQISQAGNVSHGGTSVFTAPRVTTSIAPSSDDGATLGTTSLRFADLHLASGGTINWVNGDVVLTHSSNTLTLSGGDLALDSNNITGVGAITATGAGTFGSLTVGTGGVITAGTIELGAASDTTLSRSAAGELSVEGVKVLTESSTNTITNKTYDANGTGNVLKGYSYIQIPGHAYKMYGSSVTAPSTTATAFLYNLPKFSNSADKANNYVDFMFAVPDDIDTAVDLTAKLSFILGGADTGDFEYIVSMCNPAASAAAACTPGNAISLAYTADASGADGDIEYTGEATLTGWRSAMTAGRMLRVRLERDGDHANDTSTVDSYPAVLTLKYGYTN